jgi:hypothetical protein
MVLNTPYGNIITGMGFFKLAAILNISNLFLFIGLVLILPNPKFFNLGATGVAISLLVSNLFIGSLYRFSAKHKFAMLNFKNSARYALFGIFNFIGFYFLYTNFSKIYGTNFKISFVFIYFVVTYAVLILLGWIKRRDLNNLRKLTDVKKIAEYIRGEIIGSMKADDKS